MPEEINVLNQEQVMKERLAKEKAELAKYPKKILVRYTGPKNHFQHKGRAKGLYPYDFKKNAEGEPIPIVVTNPVDVKYFVLKSKASGSHFKVEEVEDVSVTEEDDVVEDDDNVVNVDFVEEEPVVETPKPAKKRKKKTTRKKKLEV